MHMYDRWFEIGLLFCIARLLLLLLVLLPAAMMVFIVFFLHLFFYKISARVIIVFTSSSSFVAHRLLLTHSATIIYDGIYILLLIEPLVSFPSSSSHVSSSAFANNLLTLQITNEYYTKK